MFGIEKCFNLYWILFILGVLLNTFIPSFEESSTESFLWVSGQAGYTVKHYLLKMFQFFSYNQKFILK